MRVDINPLMAKNKGRGFNLRRVRLTPEVALGSLLTDTVIANTMVPAAVSSYRCVTTKGTWTLSALTAGEGPITVGISHGDYSVTEIKEALEANSAIDPGDMTEQERANRKVRVIGTMTGANASLNDGRPIKTKLNWFIGVGSHINFWAYNESVSTLTTGANIKFTGDCWVTP